MSFVVDCKLTGHQGPVTKVQFSKDGLYLISSSQDESVRIFSLSSHKEISSLRGHSGSVNTFATGMSDSMMISGGDDGSLCWWDVQNGKLIRRIRCHNGAINSIFISSAASIAVSGSLDAKAKLWDCRQPGYNPVQVLPEASDSITSTSIGRYEIFTACVDGKLRLYDIRNCCLTTDRVCNSIVHIQLSSDGQALLAASLDSTIRLVMKNSGEIKQTYQGHQCSEHFVKCCFAACDGAVVSGSENGEVFLWDLVEGNVIRKLEFGTQPILDVAAMDPFILLAAGSSSGEIGLFKKGEGEKEKPN